MKNNAYVWKYFERLGTQLVQFVLQIILARLLMPSDYGLVAIISIFILIAEVLVQSGLNAALIQKKNVDTLDINTVFWFSFILSLVLYTIIFLFSPMLSIFFNEPLLNILLKILSIKLILGVYTTIQNTIIAKELLFKVSFKASIFSTIISGSIALFLALNGFGVWTLIIQQLIYQLIIAVILSFFIRWLPKIQFSWMRLRALLSYSGNILVANMLSITSEQIYGLSIGKMYSNTLLGFYQRGQQFPQAIVNSLNGTINTAVHPYMSKEQDDSLRITEMLKKIITNVSIILFPAMIGLFSISRNLVIILLTEKWIQSIRFLQYESIYYMFIPFLAITIQTNRALGNSKFSLAIEMAKSVFIVVSILFSIFLGLDFLLISRIGIVVLLLFVTIKFNSKLLGYSFRDFARDTIKPVIASLFMSVAIYLINFININTYLLCFIQIIIGVVIYFSILILFKSEPLISIFKKLKRNNK